MGSLMTMGSALSEKQKTMNNSIQAAHRVADSYMRYAEQNGTTSYEQGVTAQLLCNFAERHRSYNEGVKAFGRVSDSAFGNFTDGATHEGSFGPWVMDVWPLVTAWYPEFPLKDLISVQEMEKPLAWLFFSKLKTGTKKSPTNYGDVVETPLGMRNIKGQYPTGEIFGEEIKVSGADAQFEAVTGDATKMVTMLSHYPLNLTGDYTEKTQIVLVGTKTTGEGADAVTTEIREKYDFNSEVDGVISFRDLANVTIDVETGLMTVPASTGAVSLAMATSGATLDHIEVNYVVNLDYITTDNIQRVKEDVEKIEMVARERALMLEWTLFAEYLKKTQFGQDIQQDNLKRCLDLMYQFQVRYILDEMYNFAEGEGDGGIKGADKTIPVLSSQMYSIDVKVQKFLQSLNETANQIELASGRMAGNRIVIGRDVKAFLESLPNTYYKKSAEPDAFSSPREAGEIGGFKVYYDPFMPSDKGFMTYKGKEFYDASYYMGMYMPLTTTDSVVLGVSAKQSFVSMEAYKFHKKNCVIRLAFDFNA